MRSSRWVIIRFMVKAVAHVALCSETDRSDRPEIANFRDPKYRSEFNRRLGLEIPMRRQVRFALAKLVGHASAKSAAVVRENFEGVSAIPRVSVKHGYAAVNLTSLRLC